MEKLTKATLPQRGAGGRRRRPNFYEEKGIEQPEFRSKLSHYLKSGFDRGHMAPGADFPSDSTHDTYRLSNIAPQDPVMNKGIWNSLEEWVRRLVHSDDVDANSTVYVVTGPLWLPRRQVEDGKFEYLYLALGRPPSLVSVPTHFYKVVVVANERDTTNPIQRFACFVIGNEETCPSKNLEDYVVPWRDLETVTGLQFFPKWATTDWKEKADRIMKLQVPASAGGNSSRLYLTDRSGKTSGSKSKGVFAEHLCVNQKCRKYDLH
jgi:DNA/RNA endonuclease G (NUC1)